MINCSWKAQFGVDCLTCGFQRSFLSLMRGDIVESFLQFPATIPFLACVIFLIAHLIFKFRQGPRWIIVLFSLTAILIVANYSIKLYLGAAFH
ncbi:MAG: DUF2752 domain-containing protein [Crocinitomicaceae bacterium]|nr:DUF2752 domain-containing protein [Crocinitomicaceae bacterium]